MTEAKLLHFDDAEPLSGAERRELVYANSTTLAYVGDAVYELAVRTYLIRQRSVGVNQIHRKAVRYVSSEGQARAIKQMAEGFLTEEEELVYRRARNRRATSRPKNADPRRYKLATGLEALIGFLYLARERERLEVVLAEIIRIIEEGEDHE